MLDIIKKYRHIFILESREWWDTCILQFDPSIDLVLTYDFALKQDVEKLGGKVLYIDHLVNQDVMQQNNFIAYSFFKDWHFDSEGNDIFTYKDVPFGFAFRIEIWNDFSFYVRNRICLERLRELDYEAVFAATSLGIVEAILKEMNITYTAIMQAPVVRSTYFFPIFKWVDEKIRTWSFKHWLRDLVTPVFSIVMCWVDKITGTLDKPTLFIQEYYPTRKLLQALKCDNRLRLLLAHYSWSRSFINLLTERPIPVYGSIDKYSKIAESLMQQFRDRRCAKLILTGYVDATNNVYRIIEDRIAERITEYLRTLDCVIRFLDKNPLKLVILIANLGQIATMVDCVCRTRGIPSYLIINGFMSGDYLDEAKYATYINSYSVSIKDNYFRGMNNVVCLGDPRMDEYVLHLKPKAINRDTPTITIGASGYNLIDLNSYLAVEFEFLYDVLSALSYFKRQGYNFRIFIKIRTNGYLTQYQDFIDEYFPGLVDNIFQVIPIRQILEETDYYISIYSQTLFEASCLGIPVLYYKNDLEIIDPPFDGKSELVTANNIDEIVKAFTDFIAGHERYDAFLQKHIMEKYIGPLDGGNLARNLNSVHDFLCINTQK